MAAGPKRGDRQLVGRLLDAHREPLLVIARRLCRNRQDADDLLQETQLRALEEAEQYDAARDVGPWLTRIMRNLFLDWIKSAARRLVHLPFNGIQIPMPSPDLLPQWSSITHHELQSALEQLAPKFREVVELHDLHGWRYHRIAEYLRIPEKTVGTRILRGRRKLMELLRPFLETD